MIKTQIVCQQCGAIMELCQQTAEEVYYNNYGYAEEQSPAAISVDINKIVNDFENKSFYPFEFI